jgi:hypothetical protein
VFTGDPGDRTYSTTRCGAEAEELAAVELFGHANDRRRTG